MWRGRPRVQIDASLWVEEYDGHRGCGIKHWWNQRPSHSFNNEFRSWWEWSVRVVDNAFDGLASAVDAKRNNVIGSAFMENSVEVGGC